MLGKEKSFTVKEKVQAIRIEVIFIAMFVYFTDQRAVKRKRSSGLEEESNF